MEERLDTGSQVLNEFLEGGYERGVVTTIYGPASSGKTTACLLSALAASKEGKIVFIDTEGGFSVERLGQLAGNSREALEQILILKPTTFAEQKHYISRLSDKLPKKVSLIICDTISSLYRIERGADNKALNTELGKQLGQLLAIARKNSIPVIITNQVYADFDDRTKIRMVGGDIIKYGSKCLIELKIEGRNRRKACLQKHRSLPEREVLFEIRQSGLEKA